MLTFYFDFISPYAYFAWLQVKKLAQDKNIELKPVPVLFAGLLNHWGNKGPAEIPPKKTFTFKDVYRYGRLHDIPIQAPQTHPFKPILPLRLALQEVGGSDQIKVIDVLFNAAWNSGVEMSDPTIIQSLLEKNDLDAKALMAKTGDPIIKEALKQNTIDATAQGVFGVPTMIWNNELYWGKDQFDYLKAEIGGKKLMTSEDDEIIKNLVASATR